MPTNPNGIIASASIQNMVAESLSHGLLRRAQTVDEVDVECAIELLVGYWTMVSDVFGEAWGRKPNDSRLMHGAGIYAMGALMDYLYSKLPRGNVRPVLEAIEPACAWTSGAWKMASARVSWNSIENVPKQKAELAKHLIRLADRHL